MNKITTLGVVNAASFWYPIMLAQERGEISESKAAELLGLNLIQYRKAKESAIDAVLTLIEKLPSPLLSLLDALTERPEWFQRNPYASSSSGKDDQKE